MSKPGNYALQLTFAQSFVSPYHQMKLLKTFPVCFNIMILALFG